MIKPTSLGGGAGSIGSMLRHEGVEVDPALAAANIKKARQGFAPQYSDNVDYVNSNEIIECSGQRVTNPS